jgi:glycine dehydrogenase
MVGMQVVVTKCDENGNVDMADLQAKCEQHSQNLACVMITYPSTHGVFETQVKELCQIVHQHGGRVYVDGANMNALVGVAAPGEFGGDVSHLNLAAAAPAWARCAWSKTSCPTCPATPPRAWRAAPAPWARYRPHRWATPPCCRSRGCTSA